MCLVDVEGAPRPMPACAQRVARAWSSRRTARTARSAKTLTEMLLAEHLNASPGGRPNELVDLAEEFGAQAPLILPDAKREPYEDRNRLMGYDPDACILCNRCVRYTQEVMQCSALLFEGRGAEARIVPTHGPLVARHRVRALRRLPLASARPARSTSSSSRARRPATSARSEDEDDVHVLRRRLPDRPERRPRDAADRQGHVRAGLRLERGQPLRQGPLRLQLRPPPGPADRAARPRRGRRAAPERLGHALAGRGRGPERGDVSATARSRSACSPRRA